MNRPSLLRATALCLVLALAGCAEPESSPSSSTNPDGEGAAQPGTNTTARQQFHGNYTVEVMAVEDAPVDQDNCLSVISDDDQVVSNVTAIATWSSLTPTNFHLTYLEGPDFQKTVTGASPLEVRMEDSKLLEAGVLFDISVEPALGNTAPTATVDVELSFEHEGGHEVEIWDGSSCDVAGPLVFHSSTLS